MIKLIRSFWTVGVLAAQCVAGQSTIKVWDKNQRVVVDTVGVNLTDSLLLGICNRQTQHLSQLYVVYRGGPGARVPEALPYNLSESYSFQWEEHDGSPVEIDPRCGTYVQRDTLIDGDWSLIGLTGAGKVGVYAKKTISNGLLEGSYMRTYDDGSLRMTAVYSKGVPVGTSSQYFPDGRLQMEVHYLDSCGYWAERTIWHKNGRCSSYYSDTIGTLVSFYPTGKVMSIAYVERNVTIGEPIYFDESGSIMKP